MQPITSMQSTLLPGVTPGWNDPPPVTAEQRPSGTATRLNRHKRLVDPSISGTGNSAPGYGAPTAQTYSAPQGTGSSPPGYGAPTARMYSAPLQQHQAVYGAEPNFGTGGLMGSPSPRLQSSFQPQPMSPYGSPQMATAPTVNYSGGVGYGGHSGSDGAAPVYDSLQASPNAYGGLYSPEKANESSSNPAWNAQQQHSGVQQVHSARATTTGGNIGREEANLIFEPPNAVAESVGGRLPTMPDPTTYRPPTKTPGDVNLPAEVLLQFLVKAAFRLPLAKCQGVQIKLHSLQQQIQTTRLPDQFIKSLNYVVDSIDGERYEEAASFFDSLQTSFPVETTGQQWVQGVRLLLSEMRRPTSRVGSAGRH